MYKIKFVALTLWIAYVTNRRCFDWRQAERIKRNGARIIGIGITDAFSEAQIKGLVTDPDGDFFAIGRFEDLENRLDDILGSVIDVSTIFSDW